MASGIDDLDSCFEPFLHNQTARATERGLGLCDFPSGPKIVERIWAERKMNRAERAAGRVARVRGTVAPLKDKRPKAGGIRIRFSMRQSHEKSANRG